MHTVPIILLCFVVGILSFGFVQDKPVPAVDHHQHLFNPSLGDTPGVIVARDLISQLDQAGIRRAALFSIAYQFANPNRPAWPAVARPAKAQPEATDTRARSAAEVLIEAGFSIAEIAALRVAGDQLSARIW